MKRKFIIPILLALAVTTGCGITPAEKTGTQASGSSVAGETSSQIVAEGTGIKITADELDKEFSAVIEEMSQQYGIELLSNPQIAPMLQQQKEEILDTLVSRKLLLAKAAEMKISKESERVKKAVSDLKARNISNAGSEEIFEKALSDMGFSTEKYENQIAENMTIEALIDEVTKDVVISDNDVKMYYDNQKAARYTISPGADVYHIFFGESIDPQSKVLAQKAAEELKNGATFDELVLKYSKDGTKDKKGYLGYQVFEANQSLDEEFMSYVKKLTTNGEISEPVETKFGWHIIKVDKITKDRQDIPFDDVKEEIKEELTDQKKIEKLQENLKKWHEDFKIKKFTKNITPVETQMPTFTKPDMNSSNATETSGTSNTSNTSNTAD